MRKGTRMTGISVCVCLSLLTGCGMDMSRLAATPAATEAPRQVSEGQTASPAIAVDKETIHMSMRFPKTLNPIMNEDIYVSDILKLMFEPLFLLDEHEMVVPNLIDNYSYASDTRTMTLTLKDGLTWHDGSRVTSEDAVFTLDTLKGAPETAIYKKALANVRSYRAVDSRTFTITYSEPNGYYMYNLCFPIIPKQYYNRNIDKYAMQPIGNGAYKFKSFDTVSMSLEKNDAYFRTPPHIQNVHVTISPDKQTDYYLFEQGITDVLPASIYDWGKHSSEKQTEVKEFVMQYFDFVGFNFKREVFHNLNIRKTVAHVLPSSTVVDTIYINHAMTAHAPINPVSGFYLEDVTAYPYDLNIAKGLVVGSGYTKEQLTFTMIVNKENEERVKIAHLLARGLNAVGMNVTVEELAFDAFQKRLVEDDFDLFVGGDMLSKVPDLSPLLHSSQIAGGINYCNYANSNMDLLLMQAKNATDEASLKRELGEIQKFIATDLPLVSIAFRKSALITDQKIVGDKKITPDNLFYNINEWDIDASR